MIKMFFKKLSNEIKVLLSLREIPLCINCKYYNGDEKLCKRFFIEDSKYLIFGEKRYYNIYTAREYSCKIVGHYYEDKNKK